MNLAACASGESRVVSEATDTHKYSALHVRVPIVYLKLSVRVLAFTNGLDSFIRFILPSPSISSIVWAGFRKVFYLFPYSITSEQGIPHDIQTMHELWGVSTYRKNNRYCSTACLIDLIDRLDDSEEKRVLLEKQAHLISEYMALSTQYHDEKSANPSNSLILG